MAPAYQNLHQLMKKHTLQYRGFTLVEIMIALTIILVIASIIFRLLYGVEFRVWITSFWLELGIDPIWPNTIGGIMILGYFFKKYFLERKGKKRLPKSIFDSNAKTKQNTL